MDRPTCQMSMHSGVSAPLIDAANGCPRTRCTWSCATAIHDSFRDEAAGVVAVGSSSDAMPLSVARRQAGIWPAASFRE